jgi:hypothetical protein
MENLFLPYRLAIKMKEIGFNDACFRGYNSNGEITDYSVSFKNYNDEIFINAPLYQQVFDWFRDRGFQISIWVDPDDDSCMTEIFYDKQYLFESSEYRPYKETRQECLEKLIEKFGHLKNNP